jgi:hypothetical protein
MSQAREPMNIPALIWSMLLRPRRATEAILAQNSLRLPALLVLAYGLFLAAGFLISHFAGDYPPPPADMQTWIDAWGSFTMLPFINVPAEGYRLLQGVFVLPLAFTIWMLMAASARLLSILFRGRLSFDQYASLFAFSFFPFAFLAAIADGILSGLLGDFVLAALRMEHGAALRDIVVGVYPMFYTVLYGLGAVYNTIVTQEAEAFSWPKAALIGIVAFTWPIALTTLLLR